MLQKNRLHFTTQTRLKSEVTKLDFCFPPHTHTHFPNEPQKTKIVSICKITNIA